MRLLILFFLIFLSGIFFVSLQAEISSSSPLIDFNTFRSTLSPSVLSWLEDLFPPSPRSNIAAPQPLNLVQNPSFETKVTFQKKSEKDPGYLLSHWNGFPAYSISLIAYSGNGALAFQPAKTAKGKGASQLICLDEPYPLFGAFLLSMKVSLFDFSGFSAIVSISYRDGSLSSTQNLTISSFNHTTAPSSFQDTHSTDWWHALFPIFPDPQKPVSSLMLFFLYNSTLPHVAILDDVSLWAWPPEMWQKQHDISLTFVKSLRVGEMGCSRKVLKNFYVSQGLPNFDVTLATHLSLERLEHLLFQIKHWEGPLSISLYLKEEEAKQLNQLVKVLTESDIKIATLATIHFVIEKGADCQYPINLMRNVAFEGSRTSHTLVLDVDLIPSLDSYARISNEIKNHGIDHQKVFVVPAFELYHSAVFPTSKPMLTEMLEEGTVIPYLFGKKNLAHFSTNYGNWIYATKPYQILVHDQYEPYVILPNRATSLPKYDERLTGYGLNKVLFTSALLKNGFEFTVLTQPFLVHLGHKSSPAKMEWTADIFIKLMQQHKLQSYNQCK